MCILLTLQLLSPTPRTVGCFLEMRACLQHSLWYMACCVAMWLFVYPAPYLWTFGSFLSSCPHKERSESVSVYSPLHASVRTFQGRLPDVEMRCGLVQLDFVGQDLAVQPRLTHSSQRRLTLNSCWGHRLAVLCLANTDYFR